MKLFLFFFIFITSVNAIAQDSLRDNKALGLVVKTDVLLPSAMLLSSGFGFSVSIEKFLFKRQSLQLTGGYTLFSHANPVRRNETYMFYSLYKFFLKKKDFSGFYTGIYIGYSMSSFIYVKIDDGYNFDNYTIEISNKSMFYGIAIGYQYYLKKRITIDFTTGIGMKSIIEEKVLQGADHIGSLQNNNIRGLLNINVGYKF